MRLLQVVERFLSSFVGLEHLSIIMGGKGVSSLKWLKPRCFIKGHGRSLKTLVWEGRQRFRSKWDVDNVVPLRSDANFQELDDICEGCPNLMELGNIDWHSEPVSTSRSYCVESLCLLSKGIPRGNQRLIFSENIEYMQFTCLLESYSL